MVPWIGVLRDTFREDALAVPKLRHIFETDRKRAAEVSIRTSSIASGKGIHSRLLVAGGEGPTKLEPGNEACSAAKG